MFEKYLTKTGRMSCKQPQDIKNQWYIQKFKEVHGDKYDYSKINYTHSKENIQILCKEHGSFFQSPNTHLSGIGCSKCYGNNKKETKQCVEDFLEVHGNTYGYDRVNYAGQLVKVEILCKHHGSFFQTPNNHLNGNGCPKCQVDNQNIVYLLRCLDTGLVKIGITNNLNQRMSSIGGNLQYMHHTVVSNPREIEKYLHKKYQKYNIFNKKVRNGGTEFFQLSDAQVDEIKQFITSSGGDILI